MQEFLAKIPQRGIEENEDEKLLERAQELLLDYNGPNGEVVFPQEAILIDAELGLSLPKAYFAFPLRGLQNSNELSMLKEALNIFDGNTEKHNPFFFSINYDYKRDDKGIKRIFLTNEEKILIAEKVKKAAVDFTRRWADSNRRQRCFGLVADFKDVVEMEKETTEIKKEIHKTKEDIQAAYKSL